MFQPIEHGLDHVRGGAADPFRGRLMFDAELRHERVDGGPVVAGRGVAEFQQEFGHLIHGTHHADDGPPGRTLARDGGRTLDSLGVLHRGAAELHHDGRLCCHSIDSAYSDAIQYTEVAERNTEFTEESQGKLFDAAVPESVSHSNFLL